MNSWDIRTSYIQVSSAHQVLLESGDLLSHQYSSENHRERVWKGGSGLVVVSLGFIFFALECNFISFFFSEEDEDVCEKEEL